MKVNFYAILRDVTAQKTVEIDIQNNATVRQLVDAIVTLYPLMRDKLLNENGDLWGHVHVFINGRDAPFLDDTLQTTLNPDDIVSIFPAVGGG